MKTQEERLTEYAKLIEARWRGLSDGERMRLMAMCCRICGSVKRCEHDAYTPDDDRIKRGAATCDLLAIRFGNDRMTPRQLAALDCWHRLYGYPADRGLSS